MIAPHGLRWLSICVGLLVCSLGAQSSLPSVTPFGSPVVLSGPLPPREESIDWDQDGFPDLLSPFTNLNSGGIAIAFGLPGGGYTPYSTLFSWPTSNRFTVHLVFDFNFDQLPDLLVVETVVVGLTTLSYWIFHNDGVRGVAPPQAVVFDPQIRVYPGHTFYVDALSFRSTPRLFVRSSPSTGPIVSQRFLLSSFEYDPALSTWRSRYIGQFPVLPPSVYVEPTYIGGPESRVSDFNGDGVNDWLLIGFTPSLFAPTATPWPAYLVVIYGLPQFPWFDLPGAQIIVTPPVAPPAGVTSFTTIGAVSVVDMNIDGVSDIAFARAVQFLVPAGAAPIPPISEHCVLFGSRISAFGSTLIISPASALGGPRGPAHLDFDGDGVVDLLTLFPQGFQEQIFVSRGHRDGTFSPAMIDVTPVGAINRVTRYADVDQDGDMDLLDDSQFGSPPAPVKWIPNESILGLGSPAASGVTPRILRGTAKLGSPDFGIGVDLAPANAPCLLAVSAGKAATPGPIAVDLAQLLWPLGAIGPTTTDFRGVAFQPLPLPNLPSLTGITLYFQWAIATPTSQGFCTTPGAKVILWP